MIGKKIDESQNVAIIVFKVGGAAGNIDGGVHL